jgi:DNA-directed RNA polymerase specialized sigma24 family protein
LVLNAAKTAGQRSSAVTFGFPELESTERSPLPEMTLGLIDNRAPVDEAESREAALEQSEMIDGVLRLADAPTREALLLHFFKGVPMSAIASQLGLHHTTLGRRVNRLFSAVRRAGLAPLAYAS